MENDKKQQPAVDANIDEPAQVAPVAVEHGGPKGLEPTRYGDWEKGGRCSDF
ncbi:MAG: DUF1674 domain-containing protein [Candidatus Puniceispirillales bacterium WSBS_2018_MAG_OTU23]